MKIHIGDVAPEFSLLNQNNEQVNLSDYRGKKNVVVYFYPKALTPGCTTQSCGINASLARFSESDTVVFGISPDPTAKLLKFREKYHFQFDLLSDEGHEVAEEYGVWDLKKFMGREYMGIVRTTFIIDKTGNVIFVMDKVKTKSHHEDVLEIIKSHLA